MSKYPRRSFIRQGILAGLGLAALPAMGNAQLTPLPPILPRRLKVGDLIAVTSPAGAVFDPDAPEEFTNILQSMGFRVLEGDSLFRRHGYFAGTDQQRTNELHGLFSDKEVKAIIAMRGGWGSARLLPMLDFSLIRNNPKILLGFSDITALLIAIRMYAGLVTFHGPVGYSTWSDTIMRDFRAAFTEPVTGRTIQAQEGFRTLIPGKASGELIGGNLKVLTSLLGSSFFPASLKGKILFVEETGEEVYRIDRMLTQLRLAGLLDGLGGFIFGACRKCDPEFPERSFSLGQLFDDFASHLSCPAFTGAPIGHVADQAIVPVGAVASMDARLGTIGITGITVNTGR